MQNCLKRKGDYKQTDATKSEVCIEQQELEWIKIPKHNQRKFWNELLLPIISMERR